MTVPLTDLIRVAGVLHFGLLIAGALTPQVLDWKNDLRKLHPMTRQIIWVHGAFIVLMIIGFGLISMINAPLLAAGTTHLARMFCAFVALVWISRFVLQFVLFQPGPLLSTPVLRFGYHGLTFVFLYFGIVFTWAALWPVI